MWCASLLPVLFALAGLIRSGAANLWCYSCVSSQPGCSENRVDWLIHSAITCPRVDDKCVKIIQRRGAEVFIVRDCLSNLVGFRRDIPADKFEGCRPAAYQPKMSVYVENSVKQLDLKHDYYESTTYCFCEFDEWCNSSVTVRANKLLFAVLMAIFLLSLF